MYKKIPDELLDNIVKAAIRDQQSMGHLLHVLVASRMGVGTKRLRKVWLKHGGPIQPLYRVR